MKYLMIVISLFLVACDKPEVETMRNNADAKICTDEQFEKVEREFAVCTKTGYFDSYCMDRAIVRWCE